MKRSDSGSCWIATSRSSPSGLRPSSFTPPIGLELENNWMMQLMVDDLDGWWAHIEKLDLPSRFGVAQPRPPAMQPWGLRVAYLVDPAGVLWHIAQRREGHPAD